MNSTAKTRVFVFTVATSLCLVGCNKFEQPPNMGRALSLRKAIGGSAGSAGSASSAADSAPATEPTGWATLKGRFTLNGDPPAKVALKITADTEVCAPGGKPAFGEKVVVGPDGGIRNVLVFLTSKLPPDEPWTHPSVKPGAPGEFVFDQKECRFVTHVFAMQAGHTLRILNSDPVGHNTKIDNTPINRIVASGSEISWQPEDEGKSPTPVSCSIHPWMSAYMLVRENGYFAVTDGNGNFEIPNLPVGIELEFRIWQEKSKFPSGIKIDGQDVKKGRYSVTLPADGAEIQVPLDASLFQ